MCLRLPLISLSLVILSTPVLNTIAAEQISKDRLAVLDLEANGVEKSFAEAFSVIIRDKLNSYGDYKVMSLDDIKKVARREQLIQTTGCADGTGQCLESFGRAIGTRFMVAGDLSKLGTTYTVSLRMLDTKGDKAGYTNQVSERCECDTDALIVTVEDVAARLIDRRTAGYSSPEQFTLEGKQNNVKKSTGKGVRGESAKIEINSNSFTDPVTGMEFIKVLAGCFKMGDTGGGADEKPVHEVCLDSFYIGKFEVTQNQYKTIKSRNPSTSANPNQPVNSVSWNDAQDFIRILNDKSGKSYRLPTEAEWEYAARSGGKEEIFSGGSTISSLAWYSENSGGSLHPVGQKLPNSIGIYDMTGNVWEWCSDWYNKSYYRDSPQENPTGPSAGFGRVQRGGGWDSIARKARNTQREAYDSSKSFNNLGFRLVLPVDQR